MLHQEYGDIIFIENLPENYCHCGILNNKNSKRGLNIDVMSNGIEIINSYQHSCCHDEMRRLFYTILMANLVIF